MTLDELNRITAANFAIYLGGVYENSPWVAEHAAQARPFASFEGLVATMRDAVEKADQTNQQALIDAHPDLAGKATRIGQLTSESAKEQESAGLDRLTDEEFERFQRHNDAYRERFGFPFILAVKGHTKTSILAAFQTRLRHDVETERAEALRQIHRIAHLRLLELVNL